MSRARDIEDSEPFFDPVLGDRFDPAPTPWMEEKEQAHTLPLNSDLLEAAYHLRYGHQKRLQTLVSRSPLAFATVGGFRA